MQQYEFLFPRMHMARLRSNTGATVVGRICPVPDIIATYYSPCMQSTPHLETSSIASNVQMARLILRNPGLGKYLYEQ